MAALSALFNGCRRSFPCRDNIVIFVRLCAGGGPVAGVEICRSKRGALRGAAGRSTAAVLDPRHPGQHLHACELLPC